MKRIKACIEAGDKIREERILDILDDEYKKEGEEQPKRHVRQLASTSPARAIFSKLPDAALELFYYEGYNCAYSNDQNISKCYPAEPLPGNSQEDHDKFLTNQGQCQSRYRVLFLSNGVGKSVQELASSRDITLTQTVMHEIMHMAIANLNQQQKNALWQKAQAVYDDLQDAGKLPPYFNEKLKTLSCYSLKDVLDYKSKNSPYKGYADNNKLEEMVCNLAGLMYSEYPYPSISEKQNPYKDMEPLDSLARQITESLDIASAVSRKKFPDIEMPQRGEYAGRSS